MVVAAGLAALQLFYTLQGNERRQQLRLAARARPAGLALAAVMVAATLLLRSLRWRLLLNAEGAVTVGSAFWATAAGYLGNNVLPARAGELVRTLMISSRRGLDVTFVLTTALTERMADVVALVAIASVILLTVPMELGWLAGAVKPIAVLGMVAALLIGVVPLVQSPGASVIERLPVTEPARRRLLSVLDQGVRGVRAFHDGRRLAGFLGLTALIWTLDAVATVVGGAALGLDIPIPAAFLLLACLGLGSALPATPGYVGIYQFAAVSALTPFGFSSTDAIAYILVAQVLMIAVMGVFGSAGLLEYRRSMHR
jgi:glycosyltransferase 2 family protein